jgi:hypothetical protein
MSYGGKLILVFCGVMLGTIILAAVVVSILHALQNNLFIFGLLVGIAAGTGLTLAGIRIKSWFSDNRATS